MLHREGGVREKKRSVGHLDNRNQQYRQNSVQEMVRVDGDGWVGWGL